MRRRAAELAIWMSKHGQRAVQERAQLRDRSEAQIYWRYGYLAALGDAIEALHGRDGGLDPPVSNRQDRGCARLPLQR